MNYIVEPFNDDPAGIKHIYNNISTLFAYLIPRSKLRQFSKIENSRESGVYILFNQNQKEIYIGQTGTNLLSRLRCHNRELDFWETAFVFTTGPNHLSPAHTKYIESLLIDGALSFGLRLKNVHDSNKPAVSNFEMGESTGWYDQIIEITRIFDLKLFSHQDKSYKKKTVNKNKNRLPYSYDINDKIFFFSSWVKMIIDLCETIIQIKGYELFKKKVFSNQRLAHKRFINRKDKRKHYGRYYKMNDILLFVHGDGKLLDKDTKEILSLFPDINFQKHF